MPIDPGSPFGTFKEERGGKASRIAKLFARARRSKRGDGTRPPRGLPLPLTRFAAWGPGLLVMLADTDAGNIVSGAQAGAQWGYRLLPLLLVLIPVLYMIQELAVRLGVHTGRGHAELIRERFGPGLAWLSIANLTLATLGTLITEFSGVAGIGELYGVPRGPVLALAAVFLLLVAAAGSYRRIERIAVLIGLFQLAFFAAAAAVHIDGAAVKRDIADLPLGNHAFAYLMAALIGAVFSPWMIFYQQSAVVDKGLLPAQIGAARLDTAVGAVLTQSLTAAVLVVAAASLAQGQAGIALVTIGDIARSFEPVLGGAVGRLVFSAGVLGSCLVAALISSLALAWGAGEVTGRKRSLERRPFEDRHFCLVYAAGILATATLVWLAPDLVGLNIAVQVLNAFLLPLAIGMLLCLSLTALPKGLCPRGFYGWTLIIASIAIVAAGLLGGLSGLLPG